MESHSKVYPFCGKEPNTKDLNIFECLMPLPKRQLDRSQECECKHMCTTVSGSERAGRLARLARGESSTGRLRVAGRGCTAPAISLALRSGWHLVGAQILLTERMGQVPTQTCAPYVKRETSREDPLQGCWRQGGGRWGAQCNRTGTRLRPLMSHGNLSEVKALFA